MENNLAPKKRKPFPPTLKRTSTALMYQSLLKTQQDATNLK